MYELRYIVETMFSGYVNMKITCSVSVASLQIHLELFCGINQVNKQSWFGLCRLGCHKPATGETKSADVLYVNCCCLLPLGDEESAQPTETMPVGEESGIVPPPHALVIVAVPSHGKWDMGVCTAVPSLAMGNGSLHSRLRVGGRRRSVLSDDEGCPRCRRRHLSKSHLVSDDSSSSSSPCS